MTLTVMQTSVKSFQLIFLILSRSWQISKEKRLDRPVGQVIASTYLTSMVLFKKSKQEMLQLVNVDHSWSLQNMEWEFIVVGWSIVILVLL